MALAAYWYGCGLGNRYGAFAAQDYFDGRRTMVGVREVKMTEKKCHERAAVLQFLFVLCPDLLSASPSGRVRGEHGRT